jgi:hypothetical protein
MRLGRTGLMSRRPESVPQAPGRSHICRREFLSRVAAGVVASGVPRLALARSPQGREKLQEFGYPDVKLTGGPLKSQYDRIHAHYLSLDNDRLLKVYRQRAGLPAPGKDMGGWYDADGFVPGHLIGQFISGLSRYARATGDGPTFAKVKALVEGFAATLGPEDYPFASEKAAITWPCYILDKYEIGSLDAYQLADVKVARDVLARVIRGAIPYIPDHTYDRGPNSPKQAPYDEPYILPENLFNSYQATGEKQFLKMARLYLLDREYFDPLALGQDVLPGKHAYSHVMALSSAAKAYLTLGEPKYLAAIENAWNLLQEDQEFASGGWGPKEAFVPPHQGKLGESLVSTRDHFETPCGFYAYSKLARYLLRFTAEARYGDGLECALYNTLLGAKDPDSDGDYFYYSDYHAAAKKGYYPSKWPCCSGTLVQGVADYPLDVYFRKPDGIAVNLFTPSEVHWTSNGATVKLVQVTKFPEEDTVELRVEVSSPMEFTLRVRMPGWLIAEPKISINGKSFDGEVGKQSFVAIRRRWKKNDTVHLRLPQGFRLLPIDDQHPRTVALMRGPLMLVALLPPRVTSVPALPLPHRLKPVPNRPLAFEMPLPEGRLEFVPFYLVQDEMYTTYFRQKEAPS